jgi:putative transposase
MRFAFIEQHVGTFPVRLMCRVLEVSPSGFYAWRSRPESVRAASDRHLLAKVRRLQVRHHGRYGSPRMHAALRGEGYGCSRGRIERLMRRHDIRALAGRRFRPRTTDSRHSLPVAPNLLAQRFVVPAPSRIWLAGYRPASCHVDHAPLPYRILLVPHQTQLRYQRRTGASRYR